eukprot:2724625-Pyramimonas_sp.AAC.1
MSTAREETSPRATSVCSITVLARCTGYTANDPRLIGRVARDLPRCVHVYARAVLGARMRLGARMLLSSSNRRPSPVCTKHT